MKGTFVNAKRATIFHVFFQLLLLNILWKISRHFRGRDDNGFSLENSTKSNDIRASMGRTFALDLLGRRGNDLSTCRDQGLPTLSASAARTF